MAENYGRYENGPNVADLLLGTVQFVPLYKNYNTSIKYNQVINMFCQYGYGHDGKRYTSYDAFWNALNIIQGSIDPGSTIAFPKNKGCCRGGANWAVISNMIEVVLGKDYEVFIYSLEE